jgi:hypothetical protein
MLSARGDKLAESDLLADHDPEIAHGELVERLTAKLVAPLDQSGVARVRLHQAGGSSSSSVPRSVINRILDYIGCRNLDWASVQE